MCSIKWHLWSRTMSIQPQNPGSRTGIKLESFRPRFGWAALRRVYEPDGPGVATRGETDKPYPGMVRDESQSFKTILYHLPPFCPDHYPESSQREMSVRRLLPDSRTEVRCGLNSSNGHRTRDKCQMRLRWQRWKWQVLATGCEQKRRERSDEEAVSRSIAEPRARVVLWLEKMYSVMGWLSFWVEHFHREGKERVARRQEQKSILLIHRSGLCIRYSFGLGCSLASSYSSFYTQLTATSSVKPSWITLRQD